MFYSLVGGRGPLKLPYLVLISAYNNDWAAAVFQSLEQMY